MEIPITIATPTVRPSGLNIVARALSQQTFDEPVEWIICAPATLEQQVEESVAGLFPYIFIGNPPLQEGMYWDLNYSYNQIFKTAKGELLVSLQDWVWVLPESLEKFWQAYNVTGACISGVGDQYDKLDEYGKPFNKVWSDPRKTDKWGTFYSCEWNDVEWNHSAIPREAVFEAGGMDEELDFLGYGGDQLQLMERINELGYKTYLDQTNESFTLRHDRSKHGGEAAWNANHVLFNGAYDKRKDELKAAGLWPRLEYLKEH